MKRRVVSVLSPKRKIFWLGYLDAFIMLLHLAFDVSISCFRFHHWIMIYSGYEISDSKFRALSKLINFIIKKQGSGLLDLITFS